jgi:hypothetical protein
LRSATRAKITSAGSARQKSDWSKEKAQTCCLSNEEPNGSVFYSYVNSSYSCFAL